MLRLLTILRSVSIVLTIAVSTNFANAYESDTHFDMMYHLSRAAGLNDGMSKMFALANQHIDEGLISSPMLLTVQRQLFHFPGDIEKIDIEGHGAISLPSRIFKSKLALAERNSAIGNYLIYLGLKNGDLTLVGLGMHIKMDTYGHAGHSNLLGHMEAGHNPDRAFLEKEKYEDMIRSITQSLVAVKQLLPTEALDEAAALKYLNKFAKKDTHLNRDLTIDDMQDATRISGVLFEDMELQSIYREDMFKKYEYKKLALEKVYEKFHRTGEINQSVTFDDLFPEYIIHDPRLSVKDIIKYTIVTSTDAEFLKSEGGKELFNLKKLFGFQSEDIFLKKVKVEVERADFRLRQYFFSQTKLAEAATQYGIDINNWGMIIDEFNFNVKEQIAKGQKPKHTDVVNYLAERFDTTQDRIRAIYHKNQRQQEESNFLFKSVGSSSNLDFGSEEYIKLRSHELGEDRLAEEIAIKITKDLIPNERTQYSKQNFEGESETRKFEKHYKATAYRLFRLKTWGVNFVHDPGEQGIVAKFKDSYFRFKQFLKLAKPELVEEWSTLASEAARKYMEIDPEMASLDKAEKVGFDKVMKSDAFRKLLRYVGPAIFPWFTGHKSGFSYLTRLISKAKLFAKDHEVEDMKEAAAKGKYSENLLAAEKSKKAADFVRRVNRAAVFQCKILFN